MSSLSKYARVAGFIYLLLVLAGPFRLIYVPNKLFVHGDAAATANNIAMHEMLFRWGMVSDVLCGTIGVFLVLALYRLFKHVDQKYAVMMVMLGVIPDIIYFVNVLPDAAALMLVRGADFLSVFDKPQRDALAMLFLRMHGQQIVAAETLWGLWLLPLAVLVYRSGFVPRFLGVWLFINGLAYVAQSFTGLVLPAYADMVSNISVPLQFGEIAFMLWILIMGAKETRGNASAA